MHPLARLDRRFVWHPFTQMREWLRREPVIIATGRGATLTDVRGRVFLDANASIWTNLHGHAHPRLNAAIRRQLSRISHCSALGLANEPASRLSAELVRLANPRPPKGSRRGQVRSPGSNGLAIPLLTGSPVGDRSSPPSHPAQPYLGKVFFSDDGSTALEVALKLAWEFTRRERRRPNPKFVTVGGAYHGDTLGAVGLGQIPAMHEAYRGLAFTADAVMAPYCYRCPFNRAKPERADARSYRRCRWECVGKVEQAFERTARRKDGRVYAALVVEPRLQGAAGMIPQPEGWLTRVAEIARAHEALLIADEVMTGFGRTGRGHSRRQALFASHVEGVQPDFLCLAKGLTGGYLPMAATLTTQRIFDAFLGEYEEFRTFFHGHSFTANPLGAAAALASLELLEEPACRRRCADLEAGMRDQLAALWKRPAVGDIRQVGLVAGVELVRRWETREAFAPAQRVGMRVCEAMAARGVLTRPVGDVVVLMPPYCTTPAQLRRMIGALGDAIAEVCRP